MILVVNSVVKQLWSSSWLYNVMLTNKFIHTMLQKIVFESLKSCSYFRTHYSRGSACGAGGHLPCPPLDYYVVYTLFDNPLKKYWNKSGILRFLYRLLRPIWSCYFSLFWYFHDFSIEFTTKSFKIYKLFWNQLKNMLNNGIL